MSKSESSSELLQICDQNTLSNSNRLRAMRLQEAKQKEALKREHRRQKDAEKEAQLVAKPAPSHK